MTLHPSLVACSPCAALSCPTRQHDVAVCKEQHCPYTWQRVAAADRARREDEDRKEKEAQRER